MIAHYLFLQNLYFQWEYCLLGFNTSATSLFGTPTAAPASTGGLFGQQNASMGGNTGGGLFGSSNANTSFGQSKPVGTGFSFGAPATQPTGSIFGAPQTSTAGSGMFGAPSTGIYAQCFLVLPNKLPY